jgi:hypothetical protein
MFADPQSITIDTVANTLPRVAVGDHSATYTKDDETLELTVSHLTSRNGRVRRMVRLDASKIASDPFVSGANRQVSSSTYLVVDEPSDGAYTNTELLNNVKGLVAWLSDANVTKLLAGES